MNSAVPQKIVLKSTTKMSLNDRFSNIPKTVSQANHGGGGVVSPGVQQVRSNARQQQQASAKNRRLAQQMAMRPNVQAALKLKKRSLKQRLGVKARLQQVASNRGQGRGQMRGRGMRGQMRGYGGAGGMQGRGGRGGRGRVIQRGGYRGGFSPESSSQGYTRGRINTRSRGRFQQQRGRGGFRGQRRGGEQYQRGGGGGQQRGGRGRGMRGGGTRGGRGMRRGGRGFRRGGRGQFQNMSREQLDSQMDQYMSSTKSVLDHDLDSYMASGDQ